MTRGISLVLMSISVLLLGRTFYLLYARRRGTPASRAIAWLAALFVIGFWTWRLV
jgi:hypothetical protein